MSLMCSPLRMNVSQSNTLSDCFGECDVDNVGSSLMKWRITVRNTNVSRKYFIGGVVGIIKHLYERA